MGNTTSYILQPATFKLDGGAMYGIIPKPLWNKKSPADELNRIQLSLRLWLLKKQDRLVLVDTGVGDYHGQKFDDRFAVKGPSSPLEKSLETLGFRTEDITDLIISHLHFDHAGGMAKFDGKTFQPVFPHATLHLHEKHYHYALNPTARDAGSFHHKVFAPLVEEYISKKQIKWHQGESGELIKDLKLNFKVSHGHTPFLMHPYNDKYIYLADLIPTSHHVPIPWVMGYDIHPGQTVKDKAEFLDFVVKNNLTIIFEHDLDFWGARYHLKEKNIEVSQLYKSPDAPASDLNLLS